MKEMLLNTHFIVGFMYGVLQFGALDSALGLSEVNLLPEFSFQLSKQIYYDPFSWDKFGRF